jgi:hypothetical protein
MGGLVEYSGLQRRKAGNELRPNLSAALSGARLFALFQASQLVQHCRNALLRTVFPRAEGLHSRGNTGDLLWLQLFEQLCDDLQRPPKLAGASDQLGDRLWLA